MPKEFSVGIFTTDADLVIHSWDDWMARATGVPARTAYGKALSALVPDLENRGLLDRFRKVVEEGMIEVLAPAFHHYLIPCSPQSPSKYFTKMRQRVTIAPLYEDERIIGSVVTIEDVTERLERERDLAGQLASADEHERLSAAQALATIDTLEPVKPLIGIIGDTSWRVRRAAVEGLARQGGSEAVSALLRALRTEHSNPSVLNSALQVLTMMDLDTLTPLLGFLADPQDEQLRMYAALALGEMYDPRAIPGLIRALEDEDTNVRYHAIEALGKLQANEAVTPLCSLVESRDFFLAFPALDALMRIGNAQAAPRIAPLLEDELLREAAAQALGQLGDHRTVGLVASLLNKPGISVGTVAQALATLHDRYEKLYGEGGYVADLARRSITAAGAMNLIQSLNEASDNDLRSMALVLGWLEGPAVQQALTRLLGNPSVRKSVVEALVRHGNYVTELLMEQLNTEDFETRKAAVVALGRIGDPRAVPELLNVLVREDELVMVAAGALGKIGDRRAFEALLDLLDHSNPAVRQAVISALNSLGHPDMAQHMVKLLKDPNPILRESAVRIAGYFGYPECADLLFETCRDPVETVRSAAAELIGYLEDERVVPTLVEVLQNDTPKVRAVAARAFSSVESPQALPHLLEALKDNAPWVRYFAVRSIGHHGRGKPEATDALLHVVKNDSALQVRITAAEILGEIGGIEAISTLVELAKDKNHDLARGALEALGRINHPQALASLLASLRSPDSVRRCDATRALGRCGSVEAIDGLRWAATDADLHVSQCAIDSLASIPAREAIDAILGLSTDAARRERCVSALAHFGEDQIDWIGQRIKDPDPRVRSTVVAALARMKHPRATERMVEALEDHEPSIRLEAITALAHLGSRQGEAELAKLARSDPDMSVRQAARAAISNTHQFGIE